MVDIIPFKATILNPVLPDRSRLVCPVYDTIDSEGYRKYAVEKNNVIHITTRDKSKPPEEFVGYAKCHLERFIEEGILVERDREALYAYGIRYRLPEEIKRQLPDHERKDEYFALGLVALVRVGDLGSGEIFGHENIFEKNTNERYQLMKTCMMNFSPITAEYSMNGHELNTLIENYLGITRNGLIKTDNARKPIVDITLDDTRHVLWEITDENLISRIKSRLAGSRILILDGHHRFTASNLLRKKDGIEYTMMILMEGGDHSLLLLPWHRCVKGLNQKELWRRINSYFEIIWQGKRDRTDPVEDELASILRERIDGHDIRFGIYDSKNFYALKADEKFVHDLSKRKGEKAGLDPVVLHEGLIDPSISGKREECVAFTNGMSNAIKKVDEGEYEMAFLMNPIKMSDVEYKAFNEKKNFPQKSTLFIPKVAEGIVMRRIIHG